MTFKSNEVFSHLDNIEYYLSAVDTPIYLYRYGCFLTPSVAPTVGNPTPGGILYDHIEAILKTLSLKMLLVWMLLKQLVTD